jgi:NADH-quinone oxidoreductase subunit L
MLFGDWFQGSIVVLSDHPAMKELAEEFHGALLMGLHGLTSLPFWLAAAGVALAWLFYLKRPDLPERLQHSFRPVYALLVNKYYFDRLYEWFFAGGARAVGTGFWRFGDILLIDGLMVNGTARLIGFFSRVTRRFQTGFIYQYAFTMIIGVLAPLTFWFSRI